MARKARLAAQARSKGNDLFKASKYWEACIAYEEGLGHDPHNAVLLCNRAAARSKLCQWEKAVDDCTVALKMRPSYTKARLRRADCNAKVGTLTYLRSAPFRRLSKTHGYIYVRVSEDETE